MSQLDQVVFGTKTFSNVLEEIYHNQKRKEKQVSTLINELKEMIEDIGDATLLVPLIKEYLEIGVKNDDLLIKMAALAQRALAVQSTGDSLTISDEEKQQLLAEIEKFNSK
jgi:hypothetical protein